MKVVLVNPNLVALRKDYFTTGIVYMPTLLAYTAAALRKQGIPVEVIDAFGEKPYQARTQGKYLILGLTSQEIVARIPKDVTVAFVYARQLANHLAILEIIAAIKQAYPRLLLAVLENTQAVTAYSIQLVSGQFYAAGADKVLPGEAERAAVEMATGRQSEINNDVDSLAFPAWDLFPLENYWDLRYAHGPKSAKRYLPVLTSRGCPYNCNFCYAPSANQQKWRARSAKNVVDELESYAKKFGVHEFHIEDLNPTVSEKRMADICQEILRRKLSINWKIVAGTKAETITNEETIGLMAKAGCRYISISPESGSQRLLKTMQKTCDHEQAIKLIKSMNLAGIRSQACFVLGFPGETSADLKLTETLVYSLACAGVDEVVLSIITPVPGSKIFEQFCGYNSLSALNFSPDWRPDYGNLNAFRIKLYVKFIVWKIIRHPFKVVRQVFNFLSGRYETKMGMTAYRAFLYKLLDLRVGNKQLAEKANQ